MKKIGFIGLGVMGEAMSKNLLKAGYNLVVFDIVPEKIERLVSAGAERSSSPRETASKAEVVITMLPGSREVKEVLLAGNGVIQGGAPGLIVIDMSSISPMESREISEKLAERNVHMLDAPVSGGEPKAVEGSLSIMVGGSEKDYNSCKPVLEKMGSSVVHCGEIGAGNVAKLANQIIVAVNIAAVGEAFVLAAKAGVDSEKVYNAIRGGLAGSSVLDAKVPMILKRDFKPGARLDLHIKDLSNILKAGHEINAPLPLSAAVMEMMQSLKVEGLNDSDHGVLVKYFEKLAQKEIT